MKKLKTKEGQSLMVRREVKGIKSGWFYSPTWKAGINVLWDVSMDDLAAFIKRNYGRDYNKERVAAGRCIQISNEEGQTVAIIIVVFKWRGAAQDYAVLAHEAFHAAENILQDHGIRHCDETSEVYAYLVQEIVDRSLQIITGKIRF